MKKRVLLGIILIVLSAGWLTPIGILLIFSGFVVRALKIDFYTVYLILRLTVWFFIQLPLGLIKWNTEKLSHALHRGISLLTEKPKLNAFFFLLSLIIAFFLVPGPGSILSVDNFFSLSIWLNSLQRLLWLTFLATASTILLDVLYAALSGHQIAVIDPRDTDATVHLNKIRGGFESTATQASEAQGVYDDLRANPNKAKDELRNIFKFWLLDDVQAVLKRLNELLPLIRTIAARGAGKKGAEKAAKKTANKAVKKAGKTAGDALEFGASTWVFLASLAFVLVQWVIVIALTFLYLNVVLTMISAPVAEAVGLGQDYANWIGTETGDNYFAGMKTQLGLEDEVAAVQEARQRVYCLLKGPACLRQWRLNNTRTPGSQSVGENYGLKVSNFQVGSGSKVDIRYKDGGYRLPVSFRLYNTRHGLKGINAYNVSYRVRVIDFDRGRENPFCKTGWKPISGYQIRESDDLTVTKKSGDRISYTGNDLYPGTSASTGFLTLDNLTLRNCGLLQPGAGQTRTVTLEVKYDYFSQATLYFEAMARQTLTSNPDIQQEYQPSKTADTPVKSVLNAPSPVLYSQDQLGTGESAQPFDIRASVTTDEKNVEYKIKSLEVTKSDSVEIVESRESSQCQFTAVGDRLIPSGDAAKIIEGSSPTQPPEGSEILSRPTSSDQSGGDRGRWFSSSNNPPFFGCTMKLSNPEKINPTGETLTMGVESNYTVKLREKLERFRVLNSECSTINCPLLVTLTFASQEDIRTENWRYKCGGPDASDGCSVVKGDPSEWSNIEFMTKAPSDKANPGGKPSYLDERLEQPEIAIDPVAYGPLEENFFVRYQNSIGSTSYSINEVAIGLTQRQIRRIEGNIASDQGYTIVSKPPSYNNQERDVEFQDLRYTLCSNQDNPGEPYRRYVLNALPAGSVMISFQPESRSCPSLETERSGSNLDAGSDTDSTSGSTKSKSECKGSWVYAGGSPMCRFIPE